MAGVPLEYVLMLGYSLSLALIALLLEWIGHHAHRRSVVGSTAGFTYHPDRDVWRCPKDQHLFPVFSDSVRGTVMYRAPAKTCNSCPSKMACTDSSSGREIEATCLTMVESGMKRFHRAVSLTLLVLASLFLENLPGLLPGLGSQDDGNGGADQGANEQSEDESKSFFTVVHGDFHLSWGVTIKPSLVGKPPSVRPAAGESSRSR